MFDFSDAAYDFPVLRSIEVPVKVIVGSKDAIFHPTNPDHPEEAMGILLRHLRLGYGKIIEGAPHSFYGFEEELADEILDFAIRRPSSPSSAP
jgi:pimeloyl-ACP methyl ester carboxylesterase